MKSQPHLQLSVLILSTIFSLNVSYAQTSTLKNSIPEEKIQSIMDALEVEHSPAFTKKGFKFEILFDEADRYFITYVNPDFNLPDTKRVWLPRGFRNYSRLTVENLYLSLCHEIGHYLGSEKLYNRFGLTAEGEADYWAAKDCIMNAFRKDSLTTPIATDPNSVAYLKCVTVYNTQEDLQACVRTLTSVEAMMQLFYKIPSLRDPEDTAFPTLSAQSQKVVTKTNYADLFLQCRLDTWVAGVLKQSRPRCWHYPIE